jgi:hypothetical protein
VLTIPVWSMLKQMGIEDISNKSLLLFSLELVLSNFYTVAQ